MTHRVLTALVFAVGLALLATSGAYGRSQIALGISVEPAVSEDRRQIDTVVAQTGAKPALWSLWSSWGGRGGQSSCTPEKGDCAFPSAAAAALKAQGITPMIWWVPTDRANWERGEYERYIRIINGYHDTYIRQWARDVKAHGGPVVVRFAHEPNGLWYPWGLKQFDNNPWRYKQAWRHIWRIFQDVGAHNARFLWNPINERCSGCKPSLTFDRFYPGNKYVDYVGINVYNWGASRWKPMIKILGHQVRRMEQLTRSKSLPKGKPIIVGELSSNHRGGNKASWIRNGYIKTYAKWPKVKALVYLNVDMRPAAQPDWRLTRPADGSALEAYSKIAAKFKFKGRIP